MTLHTETTSSGLRENVKLFLCSLTFPHRPEEFSVLTCFNVYSSIIK